MTAHGQVVRRIPRRYFSDSDATNHLTENGSARGGTGAANALAAAHRGTPPPAASGGSGCNSTAAVDILAAGRGGRSCARGTGASGFSGSLRGGTSAAEALGISRQSGSLRGGHLAQEALSRQFAE